MNNQKSLNIVSDPSRWNASRLGFWSAILLIIITIICFGMAATTFPITGPLCSENCISYPYNGPVDNAAHGFFWMIPGLFIAPLFLILVACLYQVVPMEVKVYSLIALVFAAIYAGLMSLNYFIQLETVWPSIMKGETEGLALITHYNPHGIFIAMEDLGYLTMSLSFIFSGLSVLGKTGLERAIRWLLIIAGLSAIGLYPVYSLYYGYDLDYRFEVLIISITWMVSIAAGILFAFYFRRLKKSYQKPSLPGMDKPKTV